MKAVIVISFDHEGDEAFRKVLQTVKPLFLDKEGVKVYGAVNETASAIITVLDEGLSGG